MDQLSLPKRSQPPFYLLFNSKRSFSIPSKDNSIQSMSNPIPFCSKNVLNFYPFFMSIRNKIIIRFMFFLIFFFSWENGFFNIHCPNFILIFNFLMLIFKFLPQWMCFMINFFFASINYILISIDLHNMIYMLILWLMPFILMNLYCIIFIPIHNSSRVIVVVNSLWSMIILLNSINLLFLFLFSIHSIS